MTEVLVDDGEIKTPVHNYIPKNKFKLIINTPKFRAVISCSSYLFYSYDHGFESSKIEHRAWLEEFEVKDNE